MENKRLNSITILAILLAIALSIVSYFGAFVASTYERDAASMAAQGIGQDIVDLFLVVPLLLVTLALVRRNNKAAHFIFSGTVFYIVYSFFIYCFGVHFNNLFLLYCSIAGASFYLFILSLFELNRMDVQKWFSDKMPVRAFTVFFIIVAAMFYMLWLKDIIPAIMSNTIPKSVSDLNLLVNPVHVLDIAFALPGMIITAILIIRKNKIGFILTPVFLVFIIILAIALVAMVISLKFKGITDEASVAGIFMLLAVISAVFLYLYFKNLKKQEAH